MLIDQFSPRFDVRARYQVDIRASAEGAYLAARGLDTGDSGIVRWLYRLRGLPRDNMTMDGMLRWGFVLLADEPSEEIVFGLVGRFWTLSPQICTVKPEDFLKFDRPGFAKVVANIAIAPQGEGKVRVTTETRVVSLDAASLRYFRLYWLLIGPFSGLIRKEWLRLIRRRAEASMGGG